ncbi:MAG: hypothetical protein U1F33_04120 [Alphaproteobacteria bacterium]
MKKILLGTVSALALSFVATSAMASGNDFWGYGYGKHTTDNTAVALGAQLNTVENSGSIVIGSQAETHKTSESSKETYYGHVVEYSHGSTYDHNDEGRVFNSNSVEGSFNHATGLMNVNQNNGNNVSQDAQNTVAAIIGCDCSSKSGGDNTAVAAGLQLSYVANGSGEREWDGYGAQIIVDVATQSNLVKGSFNGATGLMNVNQNNGNNVSQKSQNTVAAIIGGKSH